MSICRVDFVRLGEHSFASEIDCGIDVKTGTKICADPPVDISVQKILIHPRYHKTAMQMKNDISLLRLAKSVNFTSKVLLLLTFHNKLSPHNFQSSKIQYYLEMYFLNLQRIY